jgi:hypothetical protein
MAHRAICRKDLTAMDRIAGGNGRPPGGGDVGACAATTAVVCASFSERRYAAMSAIFSSVNALDEKAGKTI